MKFRLSGTLVLFISLFMFVAKSPAFEPPSPAPLPNFDKRTDGLQAGDIVSGNQPAVITGFSPASGTIGTVVTISGTNFSPVVSSNLVRFGGFRSTVLAAGSNSLTVVVPAGATRSPLTVTVNGMTAYANVPFLVTCPNAATRMVAWGFNDEGQTNVPSGLTNVVAIAAAACNDHNLALKTDGTMVAWGYNNHGQATVPAGLSNVVIIAAGGYHNLVLKNDGTVAAWGYNSDWNGTYGGQATVPAGLSNAVAIGAGWYYSLGLKPDGTVLAWGVNSNGQTNVPAGLSNVVAIAGAPCYSLALKVDGTVVAWGTNYNTPGGIPVQLMDAPPGLSNVVAIAAGYFHCLALKADGTVVVWGENYYGQTNVPAGLTNVVAIAAGSYNNLALKADGKMVGWGFFIPDLPPSGLTNVVAVGAGYYHSLALVSDSSFGAPSIISQPTNQTVIVGGTATFNVTAGGTPPLSCQWNFNGTNINGATNTTLTLTNVQFSQAGNYAVLVTNLYGSVLSSNATLTVGGTPDSFNPGANDYVYSTAVQADGKIVVGGSFTTLGGQSHSHIGRLNANGTLDTSFNPDVTGFNVLSLAIQPDGKIIVGGNFWMLCGQSCSYLGRLNPDGTLDTSFNPQASNIVYAVALQADGKIVVGGGFTSLGGQSRIKIGRLNWDGTLDNNFNANPGVDGYVYSLALQLDGKIVVGGNFSMLGGQYRGNIGRLNSNGTLDTNFNPGAGTFVFSLAVQADDKIVVGGDFSTLGGQSRNNIGRLNSDGTLDTTFNPGASSTVDTLAMQADGKILVGGGFTALGGQSRTNIGRLNADGTLDTSFNPGASGQVCSLAVQTDGKILAGGYFTTLGGQSRTNIGRLTPTVPATQSLTFDGSTINWQRGGSSPEVWRTVFDGSTNGTSWVPLGAGTRIAGGWQLTGWAPTNASLRARGFVSGGCYNGSAWFVETIIGVTNYPPIITSQPTNQTVMVGGTANFSVTASGTTPLNYQWNFNGTNIDGATNTSLTLTNVQLSQAGNYAVLVTNLYGFILSSNAVLMVNLSPLCDPPPSGLVGWWPGEGNANDSVGTNNGTLVGGATFANGKVGLGFRLDGTNGYVQIPDSDALKPANVTIEAWVWLDPNVNTGPSGESIIFKRNSWTFLFEGYSLLKQSIDNGNGTYTDRFQSVVTRNGNQVVINSTTVVQRGVWYHVAATYDGNKLTLYVNGVAEASAVAGFALDYGTRPVFIGTTGEPAPYTSMFAGIIDEPSIYNRALSTNEIQAIYNASSAGKCAVLAAPVIMTQPTNQTILAGDTVNFSGAASGTQPLSYQWSFNGTNIDGATNSILTLTNAQVSQAGSYVLLVTNNYGSAISSNAVLAVVVPTVPPTILSQTPNQIVLLGNTATFSVTAGGSDPLSYFWQRNGALIPGATNSSYALNNAQLSDSGSKFSCLVTNAFGSAASTNVSLKVIDTIANDLCSGAIIITNASYTNVQSTARASSFGDPIPDCVDGFGHGVWYQFTAPVAGLLIVDTFGSDFDTGLAIYSGSCDSLIELACNDDTGGITSQVILPTTAGTTYSILAGGYSSDAGNLVLHLNHLTPPAFAVQPTNQSVVVSSNASFSATLTGSLPMGFQWYFNNAPLADGGRISGSTNSILTIANVQTNDGGNYQLVASNLVGVTTSSVAALTPIILPPVFLQQPASQSVLVGSNANFFAVVEGTPPYSYQWYFNGNALADDGIHVAGSTTSSLNISNLTTADAGNYSLLVTNVSGATNSIAAVLTVLVPPTITTQPIGRSVPPGLPTTFNAAASGNPAPIYQWQLNGTNIPGATSSSYTVAAVGTNDLGFYHLVASNSVGSTVSSDAQLTFGPVAAWGRNLNNECLPPPNLSNVVGVAGTYGASFAVRTDGTIAAWGGGTATNIPTSATNVVAITSDPDVNANYALRANGTVVGWPSVSAPGLSNIVSIAAGYGFAYALRAEGTLTNFAINRSFNLPAGLNHITAVACGYNSALALRSDGTVVVAGVDAITNVPAGLTNVVAIAAGYTYAMALKADGRLVAWGSGTGTNLPAGMTNISAISAVNNKGENFGLAIRASGTVVAWGDNPYGETNPPAALTNLVSIAGAAAVYHGLALVNDGSPVILHPPVGFTAYTGRDVTLQGSAAGAQPLSYQWLLNGTNIPGATNTSLVISNVQSGNAGNYQLFVSNAVNTALSLPAPLTVISNNALVFLSVPAGQTNYQGNKISLGVTVLGNGPLRYQWFFSVTNKNYTAISGAANDTLVLDPALAVNTGNYYVAVSNQFTGITNTPVYVRVQFARAWGFQAVSNPPVNVTNAIAIATGGYQNYYGHYFALGADGKLTSWANYQSPYGETNVSALSNSTVIAIAAGYEDSLALKSDGTVYAWGYGYYGQTNPPSGLNTVAAIACGDYHDLALKSDGTVVGWGQNTYGQATNNPAATNVVAIAAGGQDSIALRADGSVVTWGYYGSGQYPIPSTATNIIAVAAGGSHYLALRANGTVVGWGNNGNGQVSIPAGLSNVVAISASGSHSTLLRADGTVLSLGYEYTGYASNAVPSDLANVIAISSGGDHDFGLLGTRAPAITVQPWNRTIFNTTTSVWFAAKCAGVQPVSYQWQLNGTNLPAATNDTVTVTSFVLGKTNLPIQSGTYRLIASNAYGAVTSKPAKLTVTIPLGEALDATNRVWTTSGNAPWYGQAATTHDGVDAARSGAIGALQETILQTTLATNWSGRCTFWWKVSSEQYFDILEFRVNGIVQTNISGEVDWQQVSIPVTAGTNVLQWRYSKDASFDAGQDAGWVDQFAFISDPPVITNQPASQTVNMGATVFLTVTAGGAPQLKYQWRQNGNIVGGNSPTLVLGNVGRAQNGTYFVTVTNSGGSTVSSNAILKVLVPQLLGTPTLSPSGTLQFTSTDANGGLLSPSDLANFEAQASTNLVDWVTLTNALSLTNGMLQLQDNSGTNWPARFYRLIEH